MRLRACTRNAQITEAMGRSPSGGPVTLPRIGAGILQGFTQAEADLTRLYQI